MVTIVNNTIYIYKEPGAVTSEITRWTTKQAEWGDKASRGVTEGQPND